MAIEDPRGWRILFLSLEFANPVFSGNGVYARSMVRILRERVHPKGVSTNVDDSGVPASVMVLCGCPQGQVIASRSRDSGSEQPLSPSSATSTYAPSSAGVQRAATTNASHLSLNGNGNGNGKLPPLGNGSMQRRGSIDIDTLRRQQSSSSSSSKQNESGTGGGVLGVSKGDLEVRLVTVPQWYKLDRSSSWQEYGHGVTQYAEEVRAFKPDVVLCVDWTSTLALQTLRGLDILNEVPSIYLNFRVFSSSTGISEEDAEFYRERETLAMQTSHLTLALCQNDANILQSLVNNECTVGVLNPPLRADMRTLALRQARASRDAARQLIMYRRSLSNARNNLGDINAREDSLMSERFGPRSQSLDTAPDYRYLRSGKSEQTSDTMPHHPNGSINNGGHHSSLNSKVTSTIPRIGSFGSREDLSGANSESSRVQHGFGGPRPLVLTYLKTRRASVGHYRQRRNYITCCCRICPEKNVQTFVKIMVQLKDFLKKHHYVPCLVGPPTDEKFANKLYLELDQAFPGSSSKVVPKFIPPRELGDIFGRTVLNIHPALYEAYGMTIVEAGAFGAPTLMHGQGEIGAQDLMTVPRCAILSDMTNVSLSAAVVKSLLDPSRLDILESIGVEAFRTATSWDDKAFAKGLASHLELAVNNRFKSFQLASKSSFHTNGNGNINESLPTELSASNIREENTNGTGKIHVSGKPIALLSNSRKLSSEEIEVCSSVLNWAEAAALSTGRSVNADLTEVRSLIESLCQQNPGELASSIEQEYLRLLDKESDALRLTESTTPTFSQAKATLRARLESAKSPYSGDWARFLITFESIAKVRYQLVPSRIPEGAFWAILFIFLRESVLSL